MRMADEGSARDREPKQDAIDDQHQDGELPRNSANLARIRQN